MPIGGSHLCESHTITYHVSHMALQQPLQIISVSRVIRRFWQPLLTTVGVTLQWHYDCGLGTPLVAWAVLPWGMEFYLILFYFGYHFG